MRVPPWYQMVRVLIAVMPQRMLGRMAKSKIAVDPRTYRLTFGGTRATKYAPTLTAARKDARYWVDFGQMKVCIHKRLPSGGYRQVQCVERPHVA